ncbi:MAG: M23 family metallopeptidase [Oscillospiraceae bacterium]|nr:M23 family metallopeptidase [Oscillospiraceae bacterium]
MAKKSGLQTAVNTAHHAHAIRKIIKGAMMGGVKGAAVQAVKNYWFKIAGIAFVLIIIPVVFFLSLPAIIFGSLFSSGQTAEELVEVYYGDYRWYATQHQSIIEKTFWDTFEDFDYDDDSHTNISGSIKEQGSVMDRNWFVAIHAVYLENAMPTYNEIWDFSRNLFETRITEAETGRKTHQIPPCPETGEERPLYSVISVTRTMEIIYIDQYRLMEILGFGSDEIEWAELIYSTITGTDIESGGALIEGIKLINPLPIRWQSAVTSNFGNRVDPIDGSADYHTGIDLKAPEGTDIKAVMDGEVVSVVFGETGYGYLVKIDHGDGIETLYAHCSAIYVTEKQEVTQGEIIAAVGNTGKSTGNHLHFEIRVNGKAINPRPYLN